MEGPVAYSSAIVRVSRTAVALSHSIWVLARHQDVPIIAESFRSGRLADAHRCLLFSDVAAIDF
eukprot:scaffold18026_cov34-Prasinocladus_malaysianus.AAC.3